MAIIFNPDNNSTVSQKMIQFTESYFKTQEDPTQIPVSLASRAKLTALSPYSLCVETSDEGNPISWRVTIPTQRVLAEQFIKGEITEKELFDRTEVSDMYDALYLASSNTIPEYRRKGLAKKLLILTITKFKEKYPINFIFAWPYSDEGLKLDKSVESVIGEKIHFKV